MMLARPASRRPSVPPPAAAARRVFDQRLVQAARRRVAEHVEQHAQRRAVGVVHRWHVVGRHQHAHVAAAAHGDFALAVLHRFGGVERGQRRRRLLHPRKGARHAGQGPGRIDAAGDHQRRVVRPVPGAIEALQVADRHAFHVGARADRGVAVVVPQVGGGADALSEHAGGVVLVALHLVAHHGHLAVEVLPGDEGIDHAVGLEAEQPGERVVVGGEGAVVVGAVEGGRRVGGDAALLQLAGDVAVRRRALEQQVFEQVRHAGFAVVLVHRADAVGEVDRDRWLGRVRE